MKEKKNRVRFLFFVFLLILIVLFIYSNLNIKTINYGYELQKLVDEKKELAEEVDLLKAKKSKLLNLKRVEKTVVSKLGYVYPTREQIIKVYENENQDKN